MRLTAGRHRDRNPSVSLDGTAVVFSRTADGQALHHQGRRDIWLLSLTDGAERRLTTNSEYTDDYATWSRDSRELAFVRQEWNGVMGAAYSGRIWRMPSAGGPAEQVSGRQGLSRHGPFYTTSGDHLVMSMETAPGVYALWQTDLRTGEECPVPGVPDDALDPQMSPDGSRIAFGSGRNGNLDIYAVDIGGRPPRRLTRNLQEDTDPTWTPDGARIVWSTTRDGARSLYSMRPDGTDKTRVALGGDGYGRHSWSAASLPTTATRPGLASLLSLGRPSVSPADPRVVLVQAQQARDMEIAT